MTAADSGRQLFAAVLGPFVLAIAALALVAVGGFAVLSAARAYVAGESMWSKGRSAAVAALRAYAAGGSDEDYRRFVAALAVPLGDRQARLELDKAEPDLQVIRAGFLAGQNADEDIAGMIRLYRWAGDVSFMQEAIAAWARGDALIAELQRLGTDERERIARGAGADTTLPARIDALERSLLEAERRFTAALGHASRATERLLVGVMLTIGSLFAAGMVGFVRRTLHAQVEARRLLAEANRRWELAADAAGIGVFEWRGEDDRFLLDERARALYGFRDEAALGRGDLRARVHPEDRQTIRDGWDAVLAGRDAFHHRYRIERPDGSVRHVESTGLVRDRHRDTRLRVIGILRDITDELELSRLGLEKQAAERVAQARMAFLSRLSHELRTPLNAVLGLAQLLRIDAGEPLTAAQARRVEIIEHSGLQLLRLVEDVLDITRIDNGAVSLQIRPTELQAALQASLHLVEPERAALATSIETRLPEAPLRVGADPQRLQQVFVNLLSNGCKYNRPGGRLVVEAVRDAAIVRVSFADEGAGLSEAQIGELFQPFKRLDPAAPVGGTGLGLVVVKLLVEQMGGVVEVSSAPGQGARFTVCLQAA